MMNGISREQTELRLAEALEGYVGICGRVRRAEEAFHAAKSSLEADMVADYWRGVVVEMRARRKSLGDVETTFHKHGGQLEEVLARLDRNLIQKPQRTAA